MRALRRHRPPDHELHSMSARHAELVEATIARRQGPGLRITVRGEAYEWFPGMTLIAAWASGIDNLSDAPAVRLRWRQAWHGAAAAAVHGNAQSHPRIRPWREQFRARGVSGQAYPTSAEALLRRALRGAEPFHVSPVVDFYNAVALAHTVPTGAFDMGALERGFEVRLTGPGDTYDPVDGAGAEEVPHGEIACLDAHRVLTRHFLWRQSRVALVHPQTTDVLIVAVAPATMDRGACLAVRDDLVDGLAAHFARPARGYCLGPGWLEDRGTAGGPDPIT